MKKGLFFVILTVTTPIWAEMAPKAKSSYEIAMREAKRLMSLGQRRLSLFELDRASQSAATRMQTQEVAKSRKLFVEQFLTAESFQRFQEVKALLGAERFEEALRELAVIDARDQDNIFVAKVKADIYFRQGQMEQAEKTAQSILALLPNDADAQFLLVETALARRQYPQGLERLRNMLPLELHATERFVILKAKLHAANNEYDEAVAILKSDQEKNLDHVAVIFELGMLYSQVESNLWPARKALSLFISRCRRLRADDRRSRGLEEKQKAAQVQLDLIDKKLGV